MCLLISTTAVYGSGPENKTEPKTESSFVYRDPLVNPRAARLVICRYHFILFRAVAAEDLVLNSDFPRRGVLRLAGFPFLSAVSQHHRVVFPRPRSTHVLVEIFSC